METNPLAEFHLQIVERRKMCDDDLRQLIQGRHADKFKAKLADVGNDYDRLVRDLEVDVKQRITSYETEVQEREAAAANQKHGLETMLCQIEASLGALEPLLILQQLLKKTDDSIASVQYETAAENIKVLLKKSDNLVKQKAEFSDLRIPIPKPVLSSFHDDVIIKREQLVYTLEEIWGQAVTWEKDPSEGISAQLVLVITDHAVFKRVLLALHSLGQLKRKLSHFSKNLFELILRPLLVDASLAAVESTRGGNKLVAMKQNRSPAKSDNQSDSQVIDVATAMESVDSVIKAVDFLCQHFPNVQFIMSGDGDQDARNTHATTQQANGHVTKSVSIKSPNREDRRSLLAKESSNKNSNSAKGSKSANLISMIGHPLKDRLVEAIVELLHKAVPYEAEELTKFERLITRVDLMETKLQESGFLPTGDGDSVKGCKRLTEHATDVGHLFIDRRCRRILERARTFIKTDFLTMQEQSYPDQPATAGSDDRNVELRFDESAVLPHALRWEPCKISTSIHDYIQLLRSVLDECCSSKPESSARILNTARNACELFADIVLIVHKEKLAKLPVYSALMYTNCLFICRSLAMLSCEYEHRLRTLLGSDLVAQLTLVDLVPRIRKQGLDAMSGQLATQKRTLDELLKGAGDFRDCTENKLACDKSLQQCSMLVMQLRRVWGEVLPEPMLFKTMASLVEHLLGCLSTYVLSTEDITAHDSETFVELFTKFGGEIKKVFQQNGQPSQIFTYCSVSFPRFEELVRLLSGSLQDIADRWADGQGPLALYFEPTAVQGLIRALFQNTDRRAAVLSRIKC